MVHVGSIKFTERFACFGSGAFMLHRPDVDRRVGATCWCQLTRVTSTFVAGVRSCAFMVFAALCSRGYCGQGPKLSSLERFLFALSEYRWLHFVAPQRYVVCSDRQRRLQLYGHTARVRRVSRL